MYWHFWQGKPVYGLKPKLRKILVLIPRDTLYIPLVTLPTSRRPQVRSHNGPVMVWRGSDLSTHDFLVTRTCPPPPPPIATTVFPSTTLLFMLRSLLIHLVSSCVWSRARIRYLFFIFYYLRGRSRMIVRTTAICIKILRKQARPSPLVYRSRW